eukprot:scaffold1009_cov375-Prasinococcus_capsulatus_cf.AAC.10
MRGPRLRRAGGKKRGPFSPNVLVPGNKRGTFDDDDRPALDEAALATRPAGEVAAKCEPVATAALGCGTQVGRRSRGTLHVAHGGVRAKGGRARAFRAPARGERSSCHRACRLARGGASCHSAAPQSRDAGCLCTGTSRRALATRERKAVRLAPRRRGPLGRGRAPGHSPAWGQVTDTAPVRPGPQPVRTTEAVAMQAADKGLPDSRS